MIALHVFVFKIISSQIWFPRYLPPLLSKSVLMQNISFVEASPQNGVEACYLTVSKLMVSPLSNTYAPNYILNLFQHNVANHNNPWLYGPSGVGDRLSRRHRLPREQSRGLQTERGL